MYIYIYVYTISLSLYIYIYVCIYTSLIYNTVCSHSNDYYGLKRPVPGGPGGRSEEAWREVAEVVLTMMIVIMDNSR